MIKCDLHIHPDYSIDAKPSIEQYCIRAQEIGLKVIGFSSHYDINPERRDVDFLMVVDGQAVPADDYALEHYVDNCQKARTQFPDLRILTGLEVDYFPGIEETIDRLRKKFEFDYLIGSIHCFNGLSISSREESFEYYQSISLQQMADSYFDMLYKIADCGLFEVIGHACYYLRHGLAAYGDEILDIHRERLSKVVEAANRNNTGFEINTSYYRHGGSTSYLPPDFIKTAIQLGARINSIGSDSHSLDHLGGRINEELEQLDRLGIGFKPFYEKN